MLKVRFFHNIHNTEVCTQKDGGASTSTKDKMQRYICVTLATLDSSMEQVGLLE